MTQSNIKYIDYLTEDEPIPGQIWVCISFLSPEGIKNCSIRGLKIRGVFGTREEADKHAEKLQKKDQDFNVFVGEMGKWLPWDPDPNDVNDQIYHEKELNDLMKGYKDNLEKAKQMQNDRKKDMIEQAAREEQSREQKTKNRLKKKLESKRQNKQQDKQQDQDQDHDNIKIKTKKEIELQELEHHLKINDEFIKTECNKINETQKEINQTTQNIESIDNKLAKIKELYDKLYKE